MFLLSKKRNRTPKQPPSRKPNSLSSTEMLRRVSDARLERNRHLHGCMSIFGVLLRIQQRDQKPPRPTVPSQSTLSTRPLCKRGHQVKVTHCMPNLRIHGGRATLLPRSTLPKMTSLNISPPLPPRSSLRQITRVRRTPRRPSAQAIPRTT